MNLLFSTPRRRAISIAAAVVVVCAVIAAVIALAGRSSGPVSANGRPLPHTFTNVPITTPTATASAPASSAGPLVAASAPASSTIATATVASVPVSDTAGSSQTQTLSNPQKNGVPLTFLVVGQQTGWVHVALAQRPNGSTGWVPTADVRLSTTAYALVATTETNTLDLYEGGHLLHSYPVASGTGGTPTPHGAFYLTELLKPTNSGYGPYAYGLSAFSDVLNSFGGGPGQIGLHGTDDESSIGRDASHGCIRMHNADIAALAKLLPLGAPIQVR